MFPAVEGAAGETATTRPAQRAVTDGRAGVSVQPGRRAGRHPIRVGWPPFVPGDQGLVRTCRTRSPEDVS